MRLNKSLRAALTGLTALSFVSACAPAGGPSADAPRTVSQRSGSDQRLGDSEHPKILKAFGGEVQDARLRGYVRDIGMRLAAQSEQPQGPWTFTVLDSPVVNAFALPGGYIYVTRGLIALANDEAELAGVVGHEIGHVTGAHTAKRQDRAGIAQLGIFAATLGAALLGAGNQAVKAVNQLGNQVGQGYVAGFSRTQEFEADRLGVRYISKGGYDPLAQADFLESLQRTTELQSQIAGRSYDPNRVDFLSTHPATAQRVREAVSAARRDGVAVPDGAPRIQQRFFREIEGMIYGDSAEQGFVRGRTFSHSKLRFSFTVPQEFRIQNSAAKVTAAGPNGAGLIFDGDKATSGGVDQYISRVWAPSIAKQTRTGKLANLQRFTVNGLSAASGQMAIETRNGVQIARMTAIRLGDTMYRFLGIQPQNADRLGRTMDDAARTFRRLSAGEARRLKPYKIAIRKVRSGDTVAKLARRSAFDDFAEQRFRVLNGLSAGEGLRIGESVKLVVE